MKMISFMIFCYVWFLICSEENSSALIRFSVPEDHHVCLRCGGSDRSRVVWTHRDRDREQVVPVTEHGSDDANEELQRHLLLSDGGLCLLRLDESDGGEYQCDGELVAELQVLTGLDFAVASGRTLLVPCSHSPRPRKRWFRRRSGGRRQLIFTRFRNGTSRPEEEGEGGRGRLRFENDALQIQDLQPGDAGEYQCNGEMQARVSVLTVHPEPTSLRSTSPATSAAVTTGLVESKKKKKTTERTLLMVAVVGLGLMIVLMSVFCVLLSSLCSRRRRSHAAARKRDDTVLQTRTTLDAPTEWEESQMIHYASLGRPDWSQRPSRTPPDQDRDKVIYSSVITRPAVRHTPVT
ncbi:uncharacterized protein LOC124849782 isoform X2 [Scophthalmus maximus]|uniref:uncharacterized protein LOC124849782 isoform X2 n=1 Tax=Scophthalmus maximus TaxID=52904 RepID=UPI001FA87E38|nr:uncharacterized protein LOC124849782 isoform X2 [Scophthalmus maximus]